MMVGAPIGLSRHSNRVSINGVPYQLYSSKDDPSIQIEDIATGANPFDREVEVPGGHPNEVVYKYDTAHHGAGDRRGLHTGRYHLSNDIDARYPNQIILGRRKIAQFAPSASLSEAMSMLEFNGKVFRIGGRYVDSIQVSTAKCAQFTSANSEWLSIADNAALSMGDIDCEFVVCVYLDTLPSAGNYFGIFSKWAVGNQEYSIAVDNTGGVIRFELGVRNTGDTSASYVQATTFGTPSVGTWYMINAYHDSVNNIIGIAVNNGTPNTAAYSGGVRDGTAAFELGRSGGGNYLNGRLDNVAVWKKVLSADQRTWLYNSGLGRRYSEAGGSIQVSLQAWWDLEEASGNRADSHSTNTLADNNTVTQANGVVNGSVYTTVDMDFTAGHGIKNGVVWRERIWAGDVSFADMYYRPTGAVPTAWTATGIGRGLLATTSNKFWGQTGTATLGYVDAGDDPGVAANWTSNGKSITIPVDDPNKGITGMIGHDDQLYVAKTDGLHFLDQDLVAHNLTPEVKNYPDDRNGVEANLTVWRGYVCYATIRNLFLYKDGYLWDANPYKQFDRNQLNGQIRGVYPIGHDWLLCVLNGYPNNILLFGREAKPDDKTDLPIVWVMWTTFSDISPLSAGVLSDVDMGANTQYQLWLASENNCVSYEIPRYSDNPINSWGTAEFESTGYLTTTTYGAESSDNFIWKYIDLRYGWYGVAGANSIKIEYQLDAAAFVILTTLTDMTKYYSRIPFPTPVTSRYITLRFTLTRGTTVTETPVITSCRIVGEIRRTTKKLISVLLDLTEDVVDNTGIRRTTATQDAALRTLAQNTSQVAYLDDRDVSTNVIVLSPVVSRRARSAPNETHRYVASVRMLEV